MDILENLEKQIQARDTPTPKTTSIMPIMSFLLERWEARTLRIRQFGAAMKNQNDEVNQLTKLHRLVEEGD